MSLHKAGWIEPADDVRRSWALSMHALVVGGRAVESRGGLRSIAVPVMEELRRATQETIHLLVRYRDYVVLIERLDGIKPVRVFNPFGGRARLHRTSSGKAILAHLSKPEIDAYLKGLSSTARFAPLRPKIFLAELALVRERGFAMNLRENQPGVNAVGSAIFEANRHPIAAITVSAPSERMPPALCATRGALVSDAARRITMGLGLRD
jgi:IclR family acetate operon transcriptional repressor